MTSAGRGLDVDSPAGEPLVRVESPETVSNLWFSGDDDSQLFVAATTSVYRLRTTTAAPW